MTKVDADFDFDSKTAHEQLIVFDILKRNKDGLSHSEVATWFDEGGYLNQLQRLSPQKPDDVEIVKEVFGLFRCVWSNKNVMLLLPHLAEGFYEVILKTCPKILIQDVVVRFLLQHLPASLILSTYIVDLSLAELVDFQKNEVARCARSLSCIIDFGATITTPDDGELIRGPKTTIAELDASIKALVDYALERRGAIIGALCERGCIRDLAAFAADFALLDER